MDRVNENDLEYKKLVYELEYYCQPASRGDIKDLKDQLADIKKMLGILVSEKCNSSEVKGKNE
jgi:hypothetical protein